ncbi:OSB11 protein, partial [Pygoscelis papua]
SDHMENIYGYLMKYTNLVTGWQYRFFVLNNDAGLLEYFVNEQSRHLKPRGTLQLAGAVISPSDEDSHTFTVNAASGEQYKLRATDAKERQHWVSRLQICTQHHTEAIGKNNPPLKSRSFSLASQGSASSPGVQRRPSQNAVSFFSVGHHRLPTGKRVPIMQPDHLVDVREMMSQAEGQQRDLIRSIECLPVSGHLTSLDQDLLMLKATSMATMNCLNDCFHILQLQHASQQKGSLPAGTTISWLEPKISLPNHFKNGAAQNFPAEINKPASVREEQSIAEPCQLTREPEEINPDEELEDICDDKEDDLGAVEEQRSVILHLLSQLKLGMDLTRVRSGFSLMQLAIFFLLHSLCVFYHVFVGFPVIACFLSCVCTLLFPCCFLQPSHVFIFLLSFHDPFFSLDNAFTHNSHNPPPVFVLLLKEVFFWFPITYPQTSVYISLSCSHFSVSCLLYGADLGILLFLHTGLLSLLEHGEEYTFSLPCAYARSILTVPWVELGGKVNINCAKTGYSASINFHTKPFYGGKLHRVTGEVKQNTTNTVVCRVQGEWNSVLEFTYSNGETKYVDLTKLSVTRKRVRPLEKQGPFESRRLWEHVTESLRDGDIDKATEHKRALEERQRNEERLRAETETPWCTKYFLKEGDGWVYHKPLWKTVSAAQTQQTDAN